MSLPNLGRFLDRQAKPTSYANAPNDQPTRRDDSEGASTGQKIIMICLICAVGYIGYNILQGDQPKGNSIPKAMQVTYTPSEFRPNIDEQSTLRVLSNPQRYKNEFDKLIYDFNVSLLGHVVNRMGLDSRMKKLAVEEYKKQHPYIRQMYFNDFIALGDTTSNLYQTWYENESTSAVTLMNEVASKYTCFFINNVITTVLRTQDGKLAVRGASIETPCGIALTEGLRPTIAKMQERAAIDDFTRAKGLMKKRVERGITELAVMEVTDKKGLKRQIGTKVWGYAVSETDLELTAVSVLKVGFRLDKFFSVDVDNNRKKIVVTMPQPTILSHEVLPKVEKLDVGWLRELNSDDFNRNFNALRQAFRDDAIKSQVFDNSKKRAEEVMELLLEPMIAGVDKRFQLEIRFQGTGNNDYNLPPDNPNLQQQRQQLQQPKVPQQSIRKNNNATAG